MVKTWHCLGCHNAITICMYGCNRGNLSFCMLAVEITVVAWLGLLAAGIPDWEYSYAAFDFCHVTLRFSTDHAPTQVPMWSDPGCTIIVVVGPASCSATCITHEP